MNRQPGKRGAELAGLPLPVSLLLGFVAWSFRKRHPSLLTALLAVVLTGAALLATGCTGFSQSTAAPGTYIMQVTGVGTNSNVTQYQPITLTITQ
jgi:hypothetical protein